jgi:hypothetical protein
MMSPGSRLQRHALALFGAALAALPALALAQATVSDASTDLQLPEPETLGLLVAAGLAAVVVRWMRRK